MSEARAQCIAVGMSGGVDSSAAAALLLEQGHTVIGVTAHMWREGSRCCSLEDVVRARAVCAALGIRHVDLDAVELFGARVVAPFVEGYAAGETPSPCILCNQVIKFGAMLRDVLALGCSELATGHYARLTTDDAGRLHLSAGRDAHKDQSYFLHRLDQAQLARLRFPLAEWTKAEVQDYVARRGLPVSFRGESQDLCFVPDSGYAEFVERRRPELARPGPIIDRAGRVLGQHAGIHRYTLGQREGLGVAAAHRLYVQALLPETNTVVVGPREELYSAGCRLRGMHWIAGAPPPVDAALRVKLRYRHAGAACRLARLEGETAEVAFDEPQFAVTPGQAAVFYAGDECLGGGWIGAAQSA